MILSLYMTTLSFPDSLRIENFLFSISNSLSFKLKSMSIRFSTSFLCHFFHASKKERKKLPFRFFRTFHSQNNFRFQFLFCFQTIFTDKIIEFYFQSDFIQEKFNFRLRKIQRNLGSRSMQNVLCDSVLFYFTFGIISKYGRTVQNSQESFRMMQNK